MRTRWFAPGRVTLIGDHTDYQLGWVLPFAIADGTTVTIDLISTSTLEVTSRQFGVAQRAISELGDGPRGWSGYVDGAVHLLRLRGIELPGLRVAVDSTLPVGAGLSSSAALTCAVLSAVLDVTGHEVDPAVVAELAQRVENEYLGAGVGYLDPAAVMFGRAEHALLVDTRDRSIEPLPCRVDAVGCAMLLVDTGTSHVTSGPGYAERVAECRAAAALLSVKTLRDVDDVADLSVVDDRLLRARARHVVTENKRVLTVASLLRDDRIRDIGPHLVASHESLRDDFAVSTDALDAVVAVSMEHGALGARLTGAGFGGAVLVLVDESEAAHVTAAVVEAFAARGWPRPAVRQVSACGGAHRLPV